MTRAIFVFIASVLLLLPFILNEGGIPISYQMIICTPFLLLLGIPHGAIDNILYLRNNPIKNGKFIGVYLVLVGLNIGLWVILPGVAYIMFLLLSAYHFGQSQFSHYFNKQPVIYKVLYLFWGVSIISGLVYLNVEEIQQIMSQHKEFAAFYSLHQENHMFYIFLISTICTFLLMIFLTAKKYLSLETLLMEMLVLTLIIACFYLMPLLIGFTLYFVTLHSFKVLREEYRFLNSERVVNSISNFIIMVTPFTLFSIAGIGLLFGLIYLNILSLSYGYCLLIVISSITLPHVFVMNSFYNLLFRRNFYKGHT